MGERHAPEPAQSDRPQPAATTQGRQPPDVEAALVPSASTAALRFRALQPSQVVRLQMVAGNRAVSSILSPPGRADAGRTATRSSPAAVQRDDGTAAPAPAGTTISLDGKSLSTAAELAGWYRWELARLKGQKTEMAKDGVPAPVQLDTAAERGRSAMAALARKGSEPIEIGQALSARIWFDENFVKAMNAAEVEKAAESRKRMKKTQESLERAAERFDTVVLPAIREAQHQAFTAEDESKLLKIADTVATVVDTALVTKDTAVSVADEIAAIQRMENAAKGLASVTPTVNGRVASVLEVTEKLNKAYAAVQGARDAIAVIGAETKGERAAAGVKAMATTVSVGGTLLGATAGMTVYANLWIGPAVDACLAGIKKIERAEQRSWNRPHMQMGDLDAVNWEWEPGGRPVFEFMVKVMHAGDEGGIPSDIPPTVSSFFVDRSDELEAGAGGEEVPTSGFWFWEEVDPEKIARWLFRNRHSIWGMLYGDISWP